MLNPWPAHGNSDSPGSLVPRALGGDRRSGRIEAHAPQILEAVARTPDLTLAELRAVLAGSGVAIGMATLWRLLDRHQITLKKRPRTRPSRTAPTS
jgi:transposase